MLGSQEHLEKLLSDSPRVTRFEPQQNNGTTYLQIEFNGDDDAAADLLAALIAEGERILQFHEEPTNLEDAFLQLTKGEVA